MKCHWLKLIKYHHQPQLDPCPVKNEIGMLRTRSFRILWMLKNFIIRASNFFFLVSQTQMVFQTEILPSAFIVSDNAVCGSLPSIICLVCSCLSPGELCPIHEPVAPHGCHKLAHAKIDCPHIGCQYKPPRWHFRCPNAQRSSVYEGIHAHGLWCMYQSLNLYHFY
jgi:hypothetical protein